MGLEFNFFLDVLGNARLPKNNFETNNLTSSNDLDVDIFGKSKFAVEIKGANFVKF